MFFVVELLLFNIDGKDNGEMSFLLENLFKLELDNIFFLNI